MEHLVYRLTSEKWKRLLIANGQVLVSSKGHDTALSFLESAEKKGLLESLKRIPVASITQLSLIPADDDLKLSWIGDKGKEQHFTVEFDDAKDAQLVAEAIAGTRNMTKHERASDKLQAIKTPGIGLLVSLALTVMTFFIAQEMAAGTDVSPTGRRAWLKLMLIAAAEVLGTTGTVLVGGAICLAFGYWAFKRLQSPPVEMVWR
ncbi:MAG: hypothetical protein ACK46G_10210 [Flavobacteriales bacterium]|jgi:hypothetical protein